MIYNLQTGVYPTVPKDVEFRVHIFILNHTNLFNNYLVTVYTYPVI